MSKLLSYCILLAILHTYASSDRTPNELEAIDFLNVTNIVFRISIQDLKTFIKTSRFIQSFPINDIKHGILLLSYPDLESLPRFAAESYENEDVRRQMEILKPRGIFVLKQPDYLNATRIMNQRRNYYVDRTVRVRNCIGNCPEHNLIQLINWSYMNDKPDNMMYYWKVGRNATEGVKALRDVQSFAMFLREGAKLNGYTKISDMWYEDYEEVNFDQFLENLVAQIKPLYMQLHAYVRNLLRTKYPKWLDEKDDAIPQHLLGEMVFRASQWHLNASYLPYPDSDPICLDKLLRTKNPRFVESVNMVTDFFESMDMMTLTQEDFNKHVRVSRSEACTNEFYDLDSDFLLRFCAKQTYRNFVRMHGDITLVQHGMHKSNLKVGLNRQACPGFSRGLAEAVSLSAMSFDYLKKIGLTKNFTSLKEIQINMLFYMAVETLFPLMEGYVHERLWLKILEGDINVKDYNCYYWQLMTEYTGIEPPQYRTEVHFDVDPSFFYNILEERDAAKIFSKVFGFHVHKALCNLADNRVINETDSGFCSFEGNREVGKKLSETMSLGSKRKWRDLLEQLTGSRELDASALLGYFQPLEQWLIKENEKNSVNIGWKSLTKCHSISSFFEEDVFQ